MFKYEAHKLATENDVRTITAYNAINTTLRINPSVKRYFVSPNVSNQEIFLRLFQKDERMSYRTLISDFHKWVELSCLIW